MKTLVLVEHDGAAIKDATLATITAASKLGTVNLLVAAGSDAVGAAAAQIAGVDTVHVATAAHLEHQLAEDVAPLAAALMADHDAFLAPATTYGTINMFAKVGFRYLRGTSVFHRRLDRP